MQGKPLTISTDRAAGILFLTLGIGGLWFGRDLPFGSLSQIGSGFLPRITFSGVAIVGCVKLLLSFLRDSEPTGLALPRPLLLITLAFLVFGALIERLGLVVAMAAMLLAVEFAGNHRKSFKIFLLLLIGLTVFAVVVFSYVLGIPLEVWPRWK